MGSTKRIRYRITWVAGALVFAMAGSGYAASQLTGAGHGAKAAKKSKRGPAGPQGPQGPTTGPDPGLTLVLDR